MKVQVLPASLADKIAAGEVVERPASVVKELVENSLDAGATNISVEIKRGGISFIRVTDDGCGMDAADAKTAFLRHATSKISQVEDLSNIGTYGFRGEALAAISAVSKIELITCTNSESPAYYLTLEGGEVTQEDELGAPLGTSIIVRDLFYNTPARLHFMKKDSTEAAAVATMLERIAIGRYDVSFTLISDQKVVFRTNKSDDMKNAIHAIYGSQVSDYLMKVKFIYKNYEIKGYACKAHVMRSNRNMQLTYLNGRFVKSKILYQGIDQAYRSSHETGKHPVCFVSLTADPAEVDVNVHPAKLEVKFRDESTVLIITKYGILDALESDLPFFAPDKPTVPVFPKEVFGAEEAEARTKERESTSSPLYSPFTYPKSYGETLPEVPQEVLDLAVSPEAYFADITDDNDQFMAPFAADVVPNRIKETEKKVTIFSDSMTTDGRWRSRTFNGEMRIVGEIFKVYILIEYNDTFYLVDKHAAHEKIIYNDLVEQLKESDNVSSQNLLEPIIVVLPASDLDIVLTNAVFFYSAGFDFYESGADRITLTAVPSILPGISYTDAFTDLLEMVRDNRTDLTERQDKMLKTIACRSAIKGGTECKVEEIMPLVSKIIISKDVSYCPHGRPVVHAFSHKEIDKMFKRIK